MSLRGIFGRPYVDLTAHLDLSALDAVHEEVCLALTQVPAEYTGGSHRSMGIGPASRPDDVLVDYGEVIDAMSDDELARFCALADDPAPYADMSAQERRALEFGEERDLSLSRRQMLWLEYRYGVYFPWKVFVELIPNRYWGDKDDPRGKDFTRRARAFFPRTVAFVQSLPFLHVGRCNVMGLAANDHGTVHRDGEPEDQDARGGPDQFITVCPGPTTRPKRLFLWDDEARAKTPVTGRAYWFNDHDYHGVDADPYFRYSIRIDGQLDPDFLAAVRRGSEAR